MLLHSSLSFCCPFIPLSFKSFSIPPPLFIPPFFCFPFIPPLLSFPLPLFPSALLSSVFPSTLLSSLQRSPCLYASAVFIPPLLFIPFSSCSRSISFLLLSYYPTFIPSSLSILLISALHSSLHPSFLHFSRLSVTSFSVCVCVCAHVCVCVHSFSHSSVFPLFSVQALGEVLQFMKAVSL